MRATASRAISGILPYVDIGRTDPNIVCKHDNARDPLGIGFGLVLLDIAAGETREGDHAIPDGHRDIGRIDAGLAPSFTFDVASDVAIGSHGTFAVTVHFE